MTANHNYGPLRAGVFYNVILEGYDWCRVKLHGKIINVPKFVFEDD